MIRSIQVKLAASHTLPIIALMPLLTLYLLYTLQGVFNASLLRQIKYEAFLLRDLMGVNSAVLDNQDIRQALMTQAAELTGARLLLIAQDGTIIGSSRSEDGARIGTRIDDPVVTQALTGLDVEGVGSSFTNQVAYVVVPLKYNGVTRAALRLSYETSDVSAEFRQLERLVLGGVALTLLLGLGLGLGLAHTITAPLRRLSEVAHKIAHGDYHVRTGVQSKDEIGVLAHSFDQMAERLEEAEHGRERQIATMIHELARPISGMRAAVDTLRDQAEPDVAARQDLLDGVSEELDRLQRLVDMLQHLQKRTLRPMELNRRELALERVLRASINNFQLLAAQRQINLSLLVPLSLPLVCADEDRLIQVITNLLDNSFKYTHAGGSIVVQAGEDGQSAWVSVTDSGIGIAPAELPHVFQEFYRGGPAHISDKRGMGLGLAICRDIITAHGGAITAECPSGGGTRVTFTLPIDRNPTYA